MRTTTPTRITAPRAAPVNALISTCDLREQYLGGMSRSGFWKLTQRDATFPRAVKFGPSKQARGYYSRAEVEAWLARRIAGEVA